MPENAPNRFEVLTATPVSNDETVVTGFVVSGAMRKGAWVTFETARGTPGIGNIFRIGAADTPLNIVRHGQKTSLLIGVEPQLLREGMMLECTEEDVFAPTMLLTAMAPAQRGSLPVPPIEFIEIETLVNERRFAEALERLDRAKLNPDTVNTIKRLRARVHLESDGPERSPEQALSLAREAYDNGGSNDADILEVLARALGENGDTANGLRYLDRLYMYALDVESRDHYRKRIESFRARHRLPDQWDVLDALGEIIFTTPDESAVLEGIRKKRFPNSAQVRKNRIGQLIDIAKFAVSGGTPSPAQPGVFARFSALLSAWLKRFSGS